MDYKETARRLHKHKIVAGASSSMLESYAEAALMMLYEMEPTEDDVHTSEEGTYFALTDEFGQTVRTIVRNVGDKDWKVKQHQLGDDVYVLATIDQTKKVDFSGWIPFDEVEEAEATQGQDGTQYKIDDEHTLPLPEKPKFMPPCSELPCEANALFDAWERSWDCLKCSRLRYAYRESSTWVEFGGNAGKRDQVSADT